MVALAVVGLLTTGARAEDRAKAREMFKVGMQHYDLAEYKEALVAFKEAYRNYEEPTILFNIGQCYRQLGDKEQAIRFYRTFLIKQPDSPRKAEVRDLIDKLEKMVAEERKTTAQPPQGTIPPPSSREPERAMPPPTITPTAPPGETAPTATPSTPTTTTSAPAAAVTASAPEKSERTPIYKKWWLWTAVGVVAVGVGVGVGVGLAAGGSTPTASTTYGTLHPF